MLLKLFPWPLLEIKLKYLNLSINWYIDSELLWKPASYFLCKIVPKEFLWKSLPKVSLFDFLNLLKLGQLKSKEDKEEEREAASCFGCPQGNTAREPASGEQLRGGRLSSPCGKQRHEQRLADQGYHWGKSGNSPAASAVEDHHVDLVSHKTLATKPSSGEKKRVICSFSTNTTRWDSPTTQARPLSNWYSNTFFPQLAWTSMIICIYFFSTL